MMEHNQASSRKRTNPTEASQSASVHPCGSNDEYSSDYLPEGPKRQRRLRGLTSYSNAFAISPTSSFAVPDSSFSNIHTQQDSDIDLFHDGFSTVFPSSPSLVFQPYPGIEDHFSPHQDVAIANNATGTPATCTVTNGTFSPGSLNMQSPLDPYDCVNQSPDGGSERLYANSDDLGFSLGDESQLNELSHSDLIFGNSGEDIFQLCRPPAKPFLASFNMPAMSEPPIDMDNISLSSFLASFTDTQEEDVQSQPLPSTIDGINSRSERWAYAPSLTSGLMNSSHIGLLQTAPVSVKASPPVTPHNPQLKNIQPSKESPITSSNSIFRNITYESLLPQRSPDQRQEMKPHRKQGCRYGSLEPEIAKHARKIRELGSCWTCRFSKVMVSLTHIL